jgi:patatin-like phospholipase/acyl hydrolase
MNYGIMMELGEEVVLDQNQLPKRGEQLFTERRKNSLHTRRKKLPWKKNQPFKILSLDGGGIRGLYGATLLSRVESEITGGRPIAAFFDLVAGTSTGGIVALGLGLGLPAARIEKLYKEDGHEIFPQRWWWRLPIWPGKTLKDVHHFFAPLYDYSALEQKLYDEFGDRILGESCCRLIIPAFLSPAAEITVFKTDHHPDFKNDWKSTAWEVARATSAAPTYLGGHCYEDKIFLDGGVWANNPVMTAVVDALSSYDISVDQIRVFSIGTGNFPFRTALESAKKGIWGWRAVIKAAMYLTTDNALAQAGLLLGPENILRLEPTVETNDIEMDDWASSVRVLAPLAESHYSDNKLAIAEFFETEVEPREKFYS